MEERLREILEERKNFIHTACLIDSLLRIDDDNYDRCRRCSNFAQVQNTIYVCMKLGLQELR